MTDRKSDLLRVRGLTTQQAAEVLQVTRMTIYRMMQRGDLQSYKIGRKRFIRPESIDALIDARTE